MYSIYILNNDKNGFIKVVNFLLLYVCIYIGNINIGIYMQVNQVCCNMGWGKWDLVLFF